MDSNLCCMARNLLFHFLLPKSNALPAHERIFVSLSFRKETPIAGNLDTKELCISDPRRRQTCPIIGLRQLQSSWNFTVGGLQREDIPWGNARSVGKYFMAVITITKDNCELFSRRIGNCERKSSPSTKSPSDVSSWRFYPNSLWGTKISSDASVDLVCGNQPRALTLWGPNPTFPFSVIFQLAEIQSKFFPENNRAL